MILVVTIGACHHPPSAAPRPSAGSEPDDPPVAVRAGVRFGCVLRESGAVSCFGELEHRSGRNDPGWTAPLDAVDLGVGWDNWCVLDRAGAVRCGSADRPWDRLVALGGPADRLAVGGSIACARAGDAWWCWGGSLGSELPLPTRRSVEPVAVDALEGADRVLLGATSCGVWPDGSARCWGEAARAPTLVEVPWAPQIVGDAVACRVVDGHVSCLTGCSPPPGSVLSRWPCTHPEAGPWGVEELADADVADVRFGRGRCVLDTAGNLSCTNSPFVALRQVATGVRAFDLVDATACWLDEGGLACFGMPLPQPTGAPGTVPLAFTPDRLWQWGPYQTCAASATQAACWGANHPVAPRAALAGCDRLLSDGYWSHQARCGGRWRAVGDRPPPGGLLPDDVVASAGELVVLADGTAGRLNQDGVRPFRGLRGIADVAGESPVSGAVLLARDGTAWRWSEDHTGERGPLRVEGLPALRSVAASHTLFLGLDAERGLWAWGATTAVSGDDGPDGPPPRRILTDVVSVGAGGGDGVGIALRGDGSAWCIAGERNDRAPCRRVDERIAGLVLGQVHPGPLTAVSVGFTAWCAIGPGGVQCYGTGPQGTLGEPIPDELAAQRIPL
jgi:hypothetical protein